MKETKCVRCGKPFVDVIAITAFTAIVAVYLFATFFFNLIAPGEPVVAEYLGGAFPIGLEYIAFSSISLLIFMPTMMAGIVPALKKRYQSDQGLACSKCKVILIDEAKDAATKKQQAEEAEVYAHMSKVDGLEKNDPWMEKTIGSWKKDNPNKLPEEAMINELIMAHNMEKAGNCEKAALIIEKFQFWEEAGRVGNWTISPWSSTSRSI